MHERDPEAPGTTGVRVFNVEGELDPASRYDADGTITLVLDNAAIGLKPGDVLDDIVTSIRQSTPDSAGAAGLTVDSATASTTYTLVGNAFCRGEGPSEFPSGRSPIVGGALGAPLLAWLAWGAFARRRRRA